MISWIVSIMASIAGFFSTDAWYAIIIGGSIVFWLTGNGLFTIIKALLGIYAFWLFIWLIAWLLPLWLENVLVVLVVFIFWWIYH